MVGMLHCTKGVIFQLQKFQEGKQNIFCTYVSSAKTTFLQPQPCHNHITKAKATLQYPLTKLFYPGQKIYFSVNAHLSCFGSPFTILYAENFVTQKRKIVRLQNYKNRAKGKKNLTGLFLLPRALKVATTRKKFMWVICKRL